NQYPKGVYYNFEQFRNNQPDTSIQFELERGLFNDTITTAWIKWHSNMKVRPRPFVVSDGEDLYINMSNGFFLLEKDEEGFTSKIPKTTRTQAGDDVVISLSVAFGLVGTLTGTLIASAIPKRNKLAGNTRLDWATGKVRNSSDFIGNKINSRLLLYSSKYSSPSSNLKVYINGEEQCDMGRGTFLLQNIAPEYEEVEVCLESDLGKTCKLIALKLFGTVEHIARHKKKKAPMFDQVSDNFRKELYKEIKAGNLPKLCEN
ncbi:MAG: hypothetical protein AAFP19_03445, partial [Bacteroidota bacterium]